MAYMFTNFYTRWFPIALFTVKLQINLQKHLWNWDIIFPRIGIIGERLSQFNPITLTPLGADTEEEERVDDDKPPSIATKEWVFIM